MPEAAHHPAAGEAPAAPRQARAALSGDHVEALHLLGHNWLCSGQWQRAVTLYAALRRLFPERGEFTLALAFAVLHSGHAEDARQLAEPLAADGPWAALARRIVARAWLAEGDTAQARRWLAGEAAHG